MPGQKNSRDLTGDFPPARKPKNTSTRTGINKPRIRGPYSPRPDTAIRFTEPGKTQQHFKEECDINNIVNRFQNTGLVTHLAKRQGQYGFASAQTFTEAAFIVAAAKSEFEALPSHVRSHFDNDPTLFLDAAQDPEQRETFETLGLLEKIEEIPPADAPALVERAELPETPSRTEE